MRKRRDAADHRAPAFLAGPQLSLVALVSFITRATKRVQCLQWVGSGRRRNVCFGWNPDIKKRNLCCLHGTVVSGEALTSEAMSVAMFSCLVVSVGGHFTWATSTDWIFPASMMCFAGCGVLFNLWMVKMERGSQAFVVDYAATVLRKPMSRKLTIAVLSLFWVHGTLLFVAVARKAS